AILPPAAENGKDVQVISSAGTDEYSVARLFNLLCDFDECMVQDQWKKNWCLHVTERIRHFLWIAFHERLPTNPVKARMGIAHMMCDHCRDNEETSLHVLRDCDVAKKIWMIVVPSAARANFFGGDMIHWFTTNLQCNSTWINDIKWPEFWASVCFYLWNWRSREYHDDNYSQPVKPVNFIMQHCREYH
ncbi:ribonuclease H, partial [Trifolium pratense]